jgi:hypothetical protein
VKVDGALTILSVGDIIAILQRQGIGASVLISPALNGTPLTQGLAGRGRFVSRSSRTSSTSLIETTSSRSRTQIATEDVVDEEGNIVYQKGDEISTYTVEGEDHLVENFGTEYVGFMEGEFIGSGGLFQSKKSVQLQQVKPTADDPLKKPDSAGRTCLPSEIRTVNLENDTKSSIPHTWIRTPNRVVGFAPKKLGRVRSPILTPGKVYDNSDPSHYKSDSTFTYDVCPETLKLLEKSIDDHLTGWYDFNNGGAVDIPLLPINPLGTNRYGWNCTGWACKRLEDAGIKPPVSGDTPGILPLKKK